MERLTRDRGHVGRRIWRRRRRRAAHEPVVEGSTEGAFDDGFQNDFEDGFEGDLGDDAPEPEPGPAPKPPEKPKGFFASLKSALLGGDLPRHEEPPYLVVDPVRMVLAVPRGAARLDAFERAIQSTAPGSPQLRSLALAFHKELHALADHAGVDLSLLDTRVEACARALMAAGEEERAGTLFLRVGRRHQAAELFVAA